MSRYRKIDPRIWNDAKFSALSDDAKFVFIFVLTHPHMTVLGAMRASTAGLASELRWLPRRVSTAIAQLTRAHLLTVDDHAAFISMPNFLRYNEPEGPNSVVKLWLGALDLVPECNAKQALISRCGAYLDAKSDAFKDAIRDAIGDAFGMACPIQELELELELELEPEKKLHRARATSKPNKTSIPDDLTLTPEMQAAIEAAGCTNPAAAFQAFRDNHVKRQTRYADWPGAVWRTWVANHGRYGCPCQLSANGTVMTPMDQAALAADRRVVEGARQWEEDIARQRAARAVHS